MESWIEFNGVKSTSLGLRITALPRRVVASERGTSQAAASRDGDIWTADGRQTAKFAVEAVLPRNTAMQDAVCAWLTGSGYLVLSDRPNRRYWARVSGEVTFEAAGYKHSRLERIKMTFLCQPYGYLYPEAEELRITASGTRLENPGTAEAQPRLTIAGSGDFSITIGMKTMFFSEVGGGIVADTELMDAFTADGATLANNQVNGDFLTIPPGVSYITWTGGVSEVGIRPRWRYV